MANYLTSAGIPCSHEAIFTFEGREHALKVLSGEEKPVNSKISKGDNLSEYEVDIVAESSYMAAPFLKEFSGPKVVHVVRNPKSVVSSFLEFNFFTQSHPVEFSHNPDHVKYERFIYSHLPSLTLEMPQLDRTCLYWVEWNELISSSGRAGCIHRIEDDPADLRDFLGSEGNYHNNRCNSVRKQPRIRWSSSDIEDETIRKRFLDLAGLYGYSKKMESDLGSDSIRLSRKIFN